MRFDSLGMFWQDIQTAGKRRDIVRPMPPIPETGWRPPTSYPNLSNERVLGFDVETWDPELLENGPGWARGKSHLVGVSLATIDGGKWYFPIRHTVEKEHNLDPEITLRYLADTLGNPRSCKVGANCMYDVGTLGSEGVSVRGSLFDVQYAEALLTESAHVDLDTLAHKYLGIGKQTSLLYEWCAKYYGGDPDDSQRKNIYRSPPRLVGPYAESDAALPLLIGSAVWPLLVQQGLEAVYTMECELIPLLVAMRRAGVTVDVNKAEELRATLLGKEADKQKQLRSLTNFDVDVNSGQSIARAFDAAGLAYSRTKKGNPSFTKDFLKACKGPIPSAIMDIRRLQKLRSTFIESYILESNVDGKIYCQFHPLRQETGGTRSGRYSSSDPNLQNIPIRDKELGKLIRSLFRPDHGHVAWRKYDFSQIEYRMLIHYAVGPGSDEARANFNMNPDMDYHDWAMDLVAPKAGWDISTPELRDYWRRPTKNLNFGLIFGMGEKHMAETLGVSRKEAKIILAAYHAGVPFAKATMNACSNEVQQLGFITTLLGRRSRFDLWEPPGHHDQDSEIVPLSYNEALRLYGPQIQRAYAYRGLNRRLQGGAADVLKAGMYLNWKHGIFDVTGVPRLTVHDELDFSDPGDRVEAFREMAYVMENAIKVRIPIRMDGDIGSDWGNVVPITKESENRIYCAA